MFTCDGAEYFMTALVASVSWCFLIYSIREIIRICKLSKRGKLADGRITKKFTTTGNRTCYYLYYEFEVQDPEEEEKEIISDSHQVSEKLYTESNENDIIKIRYDPYNPESNNLPLSEYSSLAWIFWLVMWILLLGGSLSLNVILCPSSNGNGLMSFLLSLALYCIYIAGFLVLTIICGAICFGVIWFMYDDEEDDEETDDEEDNDDPIENNDTI